MQIQSALHNFQPYEAVLVGPTKQGNRLKMPPTLLSSNTIGERGIQLSGGQRQRIGIARALYKKADVIIFDEATSALDGETELDVMSAIEGLDKDLTVIIIAHRLSTLKSCTKIIQLDQGSISWSGSYGDVPQA